MRIFRLVYFFAATLSIAPIILALSLLPQYRAYRACYAVLRTYCRLLCRVLGLRLREVALDNDPAEFSSTRPRMIVSNHVSYLDIPVLLARGVPCVFLGKKEIQDWPVISTIARAAGMVFVDRASIFARARAMLDIQQHLQKGMNVVIFPEGTTKVRGSERDDAPFFAGAFRLSRMEDVEVEMIHLSYEAEKQIAWLDDAELLKHWWAFLARPSTDVLITRARIAPIQDRREQRAQHRHSRTFLREHEAAV